MPTAETDWSAFRVGQMSWPTFVKRNLIHADLLKAVVSRSRGAILEVGVGSGAQSAMLSRAAHLVVTVDNDRRIMTASLPNLRRYGKDVALVAADAFRLPFPDQSFGVAVSQGLMEHFPDEEIAALLREQLRVCRSVVFSVPSDNYPRQDVGNERLLTPYRWSEIVNRAVDPSLHQVCARYYKLDLEALKYSVLNRRALGSFSVLVTIDRND